MGIAQSYCLTKNQAQLNRFDPCNLSGQFSFKLQDSNRRIVMASLFHRSIRHVMLS